MRDCYTRIHVEGSEMASTVYPFAVNQSYMHASANVTTERRRRIVGGWWTFVDSEICPRRRFEPKGVEDRSKDAQQTIENVSETSENDSGCLRGK